MAASSFGGGVRLLSKNPDAQKPLSETPSYICRTNSVIITGTRAAWWSHPFSTAMNEAFPADRATIDLFWPTRPTTGPMWPITVPHTWRACVWLPSFGPTRFYRMQYRLSRL
jgi:hypothetical protein